MQLFSTYRLEKGGGEETTTAVSGSGSIQTIG